MTEHTNVELTRRAYDAFAKGDLAALSSDRRRCDLARARRGAAQRRLPRAGGGLRVLRQAGEETAGRSQLDVHDLLANDEPRGAVHTGGFRRAKSVETPVANVTHVHDGKVTEFWAATTDPQASIDFWS